MKNFKSLLIVLILFLGGCKNTTILWGAKIDREEVAKDLRINKDGTELILIGKKYNYILNDKKKYIKNLVQGIDESISILNVDNITAKGKEVKGIKFIIKAEKKDLSQKQERFLRSIGAKEWGRRPTLYRQDPELHGSRNIVSSKEFKHSLSQYKPTGIFKTNQKTAIFEEPTPLQVTGKILVTPFALAADIILLPLTIPMFFYHQYRESRSLHYCQGVFCNPEELKQRIIFDAIKQSNKQKNETIN